MLFMSATYKSKRVDPRIESCGTPKFVYQFVQNVVCKSSKKSLRGISCMHLSNAN